MSIGRWVFWLGGAAATALAIELAGRQSASAATARVQPRPLPAGAALDAAVQETADLQLAALGYGMRASDWIASRRLASPFEPGLAEAVYEARMAALFRSLDDAFRAQNYMPPAPAGT